MADIDTITQLIKDRLHIGWNRYGRGLLHPQNDALDYKQEALEEALDLVIYASADAVRKSPPVSAKINVVYDGDVPRVDLKLVVNYEMEHDGNDAVLNNIVSQATKKYEYGGDKTSDENKLMLLGLGVLGEYVKHTVNPHA
ncbi:hypothetical protein BST79_gp311 [Only Syngen Nebraska virus 5]|jgi:hypothetical protein|uniref:hypothetical protein n=1 Tax=Only Syngen Nebraska virus 5 TaxID=1917232 RepID=UPI000901AED7|nr:hypothetical protein BST79_gp311 [Only Syngen Nebraska virus 5]APC25824.1 hypothetical protein [Only Syngen Nebraska virus 5]